MGASFRLPAPQAGLPFSPTQAKGELLTVDYLDKTWSSTKVVPVPQPPYDPALIASYFKSKQWTARNTTLNGRAAIELTLKDRDVQGKATVNSWTEYLWIDASMYLPLHADITFGPPKMVEHAVEDYQYLQPTPANLAKLTPPIPAGFKQATPPPAQNVAPSIITLSPSPSPTRAQPH